MCCHLSRSLTELTRHAIPHIKNNHAPPTISFVNGINQTIRNPILVLVLVLVMVVVLVLVRSQN